MSDVPEDAFTEEEIRLEVTRLLREKRRSCIFKAAVFLFGVAETAAILYLLFAFPAELQVGFVDMAERMGRTPAFYRTTLVWASAAALVAFTVMTAVKVGMYARLRREPTDDEVVAAVRRLTWRGGLQEADR